MLTFPTVKFFLFFLPFQFLLLTNDVFNSQLSIELTRVFHLYKKFIENRLIAIPLLFWKLMCVC